MGIVVADTADTDTNDDDAEDDVIIEVVIAKEVRINFRLDTQSLQPPLLLLLPVSSFLLIFVIV